MHPAILPRMFTGLITSIGEITHTEPMPGGGLRVCVDYGSDTSLIPLGASIAHDGICLTLCTHAGNSYWVELSSTTLACTNAGHWHIGRKLNLERALCMGAELGGHLVSGHVDTVCTLTQCMMEAGWAHLEFQAPRHFACYIAEKGSLALNGTSLTITHVRDTQEYVIFGVTLIPHTLQATTWQYIEVGDAVNLEIDMLARYILRAQQCKELA